MLLSKSCEYGIRSALYLASRPEEDFIPIRVIGSALGVSPHFLTKILQRLTQVGIMKSLRGPKGGVALARSPSEVYLHEIVIAIDGPGLFTECILGMPGCGEGRPCPLHEQWGATREQLYGMFSDLTLEELGHRIISNNLRITDVPLPMSGNDTGNGSSD
jgi:Rrf2 family protein